MTPQSTSPGSEVDPAHSAGLHRLLQPRSIGVIGASADPGKFGGRPLSALKRWGFTGDLVAVNPRHRDIDGTACVASVEELPENIDLAVILLPAEMVLDAAEVAIARGVGAIAVFSGGFGEAGSDGAVRQERLRQVAAEAGVRVLGPNCPGFVNVRDDIACSASGFAQRDDMFPGAVSLVVQSGAIGGILADRAFSRGIGLNSVVCTGNEVDVTAAELIRWFADDDATRAVGLYLEGLGRGDALMKAFEYARDAGLGLTVLKSGRSDAGRRIIGSHTATVVGVDAGFDALCAEFGVVRVDDYHSLLETAAFLADLDGPIGRGIAVVGASGGMNTLIADAAEEAGLSLPPLSQETVGRLAELTPDFGTADNPVDISSLLIVDPTRLGKAVECLGADSDVDAVVVIIGDHPPGLSVRFAEVVIDAADAADVPVVVQWSAGELSDPGIDALGRAGVPVFTEPQGCVRALARAIAARSPRRGRPDPIVVPLASPRPATESEVKSMLAESGVPIPRQVVIEGPDAAEEAVVAVGGRAVIKADGVGMAHKTDIGAVRLDVTPDQAFDVAAEIMDKATSAIGSENVRGLIVEQFVSPVAEFLVSVERDDHAGAVVTVGAGGVLVEVLADTAQHIAPVDVETAREMVLGLRSSRLLLGFRGQPEGDIDALARVVSLISRIAAGWGDALRLLEMNPVAVLEDGCMVLDGVAEWD